MPPISLMESAPGPETVIDGIRYLYFGGTSYLGLAGHPEVIEAGCAALRDFGVHSATSRARFGEAHRDSIFRVGSISKLFNAIAVLQQVEVGKLDLDAPLPAAVLPLNPFPGAPAITLRQILCHRSGLQREAPIGGYFDDTEARIARHRGERPPLRARDAARHRHPLLQPRPHDCGPSGRARERPVV